MEIKEKNLNELSGLSRLYHHILTHDCAILTAFKGNLRNCLIGCEFPAGHKFTRTENIERNRQLKTSLLMENYGITNIDGSWIEGYGTPEEKQYKEDSFFVVNEKNNTNFVQKIKELGKIFCQDSVLIKEIGSENAYLIGTNNSDYPGFDKVDQKGIFKGGETSEFLSKVGNRPFTFDVKENYNVMTLGSIISPMSKKVWKLLEHFKTANRNKNTV